MKKNKAKLAFHLLEQEMEVIYKEDLMQFIGGSGGYTWQQFVNDIQNGNFNNVPAGTYEMNYDGSFTINGGMLNEVVVYSNHSSGGYGYSSSGSYSSNGYLNDPYFMNSQFWMGSGYSSGGSSGGGGGYYVSPTYVAGTGSTPPEWGIDDFFDHYNTGNGEAVNLNDMGLRGNVISSDTYLQMMTNVNTQIENYVHSQVAEGCNYPGTFQFTWDFNNSYDFTLDSGLFAIGSATIAGQFTGEFTIDVNGQISVNGSLDLNFHDVFEDPWDIANITEGSWDPTGTPYDINDNWQQEIMMQNIVP